jgi:hypothetical protein
MLKLIMDRLLKPLIAPVVDNSPRDIRVYWDPEACWCFAITDGLEIRRVVWVNPPDLLHLNGAAPVVTNALTLSQIRHQLVRGADSYSSSPLPETAMKDHQADRSSMANHPEAEQPSSRNGNGNGKPSPRAADRALTHAS